MSNNVDSKAVTNSVKIYELLLAAYPADFRSEYGAAMKQLFHDQCRDAWSQGRSWSLAALWLCALSDWAKTSIMEHFASVKQKAPIFRRVFAAAMAVAIVSGAIITFCTRPLYVSTAIIEVLQESEKVPLASADPYFMDTQCRIIESYRVLTNVIVNLRLDEKLAQQNGAPRWSVEDSFAYLQPRLSIKKPRTTSLLEISARNPDASLAASIANAVADSYREFRLDSWKQTRYRGIQALEEKLTSTLADLHSAETTPDATAKANLQSQRRNYHQLERLLASAEVGKLNQIDVIVRNAAKPNMNSVVQTKSALFLSWVLWGTLLALLAGGGSALLAGQRSAG
jgi:capsular polysaccharide biosynthesis protein